jgi:hypothetical protein
MDLAPKCSTENRIGREYLIVLDSDGKFLKTGFIWFRTGRNGGLI